MASVTVSQSAPTAKLATVGDDSAPLVLVASSNTTTTASGLIPAPVVAVSFASSKLPDLLLTLSCVTTVVQLPYAPKGDVSAKFVSGTSSTECRLSLFGMGVL